MTMRELKLIIIIFLVSGNLLQPFWCNGCLKINNEPVSQLPALNNIGAPQWNYVDILVRDSITYCLTNWWYISEVYDFTNHKEPIKIIGREWGSYGHFGGYTAMNFFGDYICFINATNLSLFDISQPANITIKSSSEIKLNCSYIGKLRIMNNIGFITSSYYGYNSTLDEYIFNGSLTLVNLVGFQYNIISEYLNHKLVRDVAIKGNYAYLLNSKWGDAGKGGFEIIDIGNPANPVLISEWQDDCRTESLKIINNHLFLATDKGLLVFDISDPLHPKKIDEYKNNLYMKYIFCVEDLLYVTFDDGLIIFDISDPENVKQVGMKKIFFEGNGGFNELVVENDYVYALRQTEYEGREIFVFDVSNPSYPKKLYPSGIKFGHEVFSGIFIASFWIGLPLILLTIIIVPILVVRKRRKKRSKETKNKEIMNKPASQEDSKDKSISDK